MAFQKHLGRNIVFALIIAISFFVGWFIPAYYDWTGSDQSRPSPLIWQTAVGLMVGGVIICSVLPWLELADARPGTDPTPRVRFKIRTMFLMTAAVAAGIEALIRFPLVVSGSLCALALGHLAWFWVRYRQYRWQTAALLACMYLPFVWFIADDNIDLVSMVTAIPWMASVLPAFFPACLIGGFVGQNSHDMVWLSILLTGAEIFIGTWLIRLGPRRTLAYLVLTLLVSTFSSFGLNALVRA